MISRREFTGMVGAGILSPQILEGAEVSRVHPFKSEQVMITCLGSEQKPACQMDAHLHNKACNVLIRPFIDSHNPRPYRNLGLADMVLPKLSDMPKPSCEFKHLRVKLRHVFLGISEHGHGYVYSGDLDDFCKELFRMLRGESNWMTTHLHVIVKHGANLDDLLLNSGPETYWIDVDALERSMPIRGNWGRDELS